MSVRSECSSIKTRTQPDRGWEKKRSAGKVAEEKAADLKAKAAAEHQKAKDIINSAHKLPHWAIPHMNWGGLLWASWML